MIYVKQGINIDECISDKYLKLPEIFKRIIYIYKNFFNIITIKKKENFTIAVIPTKCVKNINLKKAQQFAAQLTHKTKNIVISKSLSKIDVVSSEFTKAGFNILNGRFLFKFLIVDCFNYILNNQNKKLEEISLAILINNKTKINMDIIELLAKKVKNLIIVTNKPNDFRELEKHLYNTFGIMIRISNNYKKVLLNQDYIVNIDFDEDVINKFNIKSTAIIININKKINIKNKYFLGININYYHIIVRNKILEMFKQNNLYNDFCINELYESLVYNNYDIYSLLKKDFVKINQLIGNNGIIHNSEYARIIKENSIRS